MIHHSKGVMVGGRRNFEHVFEPVGAVGNFHGHPIGLVVFHSAVPVQSKTQNIFVEGVFGGAIANHPSGVNDLIAQR